MTEEKNYTIVVQEMKGSDELFIELPDEVINRLGWNEDTEVEFTVVDNQGFMIKKVEAGRDG